MYVTALLFIAFDFITGFVQALKNRRFRSSIMRNGLYRKAGSILMILFAYLLDLAGRMEVFDFPFPVAGWIILYICIMEVGSIIENIGYINKNIIPKFLKKYFEKLKEENDEN